MMGDKLMSYGAPTDIEQLGGLTFGISIIELVAIDNKANNIMMHNIFQSRLIDLDLQRLANEME